MAIKSIFIQWSQAMQEQERLLDDLARWTDINTIELSDVYRDWTPGGQEGPASMAVHSAAAFGDLTVPVAPEVELESLLRYMALAKSKGFNVACNFTPLFVNVRDDPSLALVDVTEQRGSFGDYATYGCPNNPQVIRYGESLMREVIATWTSADMIDVNHVEYPLWAEKGVQEIFVCFCKWCRVKAEAQGIDFDQMKRAATYLYNSLVATRPSGSKLPANITANDLLNLLLQQPELAIWLNFRVSSMSAFVTRVVQAGRAAAEEHNPDIKIGLEFLLPAMSSVMGTDFAALYPLFDWITPKFPDYLPGSVIPAIADELSARTAAWDPVDIMRLIRELFDLGPGPQTYHPLGEPTPDIRYSNAYDLSIPERQMKHLEPLVGKVPMYPYLWLTNSDLDHMRGKIGALRKLGFDGQFVWCWEPDLTTEAIRAAQGVF